MCSLHHSTIAAADVATVLCVILASVTSTTAHLGANGETRCYCNEAGCVSTGYMCKSTRLGFCFSQLSREDAVIRSTHGCGESLPELDYSACVQSGHSATSGSHVVSGDIVLICCQSDMCNYMDSVVANGAFFSRRDGDMLSEAVDTADGKRLFDSRLDHAHFNSTERHQVVLPLSISEIPNTDDNELTSGSELMAAVTSDSGLWLRISIIAVPVVGFCLLIPLVVIAVRLLTSDRRGSSANANGQLCHWLLAGHTTSAATGTSIPTVSDRFCSLCRTTSVGWCDCEHQKCSVQIDDGDHKQSSTGFASSPASSSHHFVMAAIHNSTSGRRGYELIRTHVVSAAALSNRCSYHQAVVPMHDVTGHSLGGSTDCCAANNSKIDRTLAFTV